MGWRVMWRVTCEECGAVGPLSNRSDVAQGKAVGVGWVAAWAPSLRGGMAHLCPECAEKPRPAWWPQTGEE